MGVRASLFVFGFRLVSGHPTSVLFPTQWAHKTTKTLSTTRTNIRLFLGESLVLQATVLLKATVTKTSKASLAYIQKVLGACIVHWSPLLLNMLSFQSRDFLLKPDLLRAISDLGFEHPSEIVSSLTNAIITPAVSEPQGLNGGVVTPNREAQVSKASERRDLGEGKSASHDNQWWTLFTLARFPPGRVSADVYPQMRIHRHIYIDMSFLTWQGDDVHTPISITFLSLNYLSIITFCKFQFISQLPCSYLQFFPLKSKYYSLQ